jgi:hypothetical protein
MTFTDQSISWDDSINEIRCSYKFTSHPDL